MSAADVLNHFDKKHFLKMATQEGLPLEEKDSKKTCVDVLQQEIENAGIRALTNNLKRSELENIVEPLKLEISKSAPKSVHSKMLMKSIDEIGLENFLSKHMDAPRLKLIISILTDEDEKDISGDKKSLVAQTYKAIHEAGMEVFFSRFDAPFLSELMDKLKLKYNTDNNFSLARGIATQSAAMKPTQTVGAPVFSETKQPIKKGITYQDIYQHYFTEELTKYCKENGLKVSGNKKEVITRILKFLNGDKSTLAASGPVKRKRPANPDSKKSKKAKKSPKKEKSEKTEKKK